RCDSHIVGGNDDGIQVFGVAAAFPDIFQKRFSSNKMQRFSREACRIPPGRYDSSGFTHPSMFLITSHINKRTILSEAKNPHGMMSSRLAIFGDATANARSPSLR